MQYLPLLQLLPAVFGLIRMAENNGKPGSGIAKKSFVVGMVKGLVSELAKASGQEDEFEEIEVSLGFLIDIIVGLLFVK